MSVQGKGEATSVESCWLMWDQEACGDEEGPVSAGRRPEGKGLRLEEAWRGLRCGQAALKESD